MSVPVRTLAFDCDDTLWHHEGVFRTTRDAYVEILQKYVPEAAIGDRLSAVEIANLKLFGYGVKGFTLSMIETALEMTQNRISSTDIGRIIDLGKEMLNAPVPLIDGVAEVIELLKPHYRMMAITKGDLFDQETKLARSGLADQFELVEIVSEKNVETYQEILSRYALSPRNFLMVGNSPKSDILPVVELGARAVHIPYSVTWEHEQVDLSEGWPEGVYELETIRQLPALLQGL